MIKRDIHNMVRQPIGLSNKLAMDIILVVACMEMSSEFQLTKFEKQPSEHLKKFKFQTISQPLPTSAKTGTCGGTNSST